ncbi:hypothetical protein ACVWWG_007597 [Bradyrhizobium sp. LB7.2]
MVSDLFWDAATSWVVLGVLVLIGVVAFVVAHVPAFAARIYPPVAAYSKAAALVQVLAWALLCFLIGFRIADERMATRQLKNDLAFKELQIDQAEETAKDAERLKAEADAKAKEAMGQLDDYRKRFGANPDAVCAFTPDDLERLRNLRRSKR